MDRNLLSMCTVPMGMIFCSSLMLLAAGIFANFWSIPSLISPSATTISGTVSVLIPHILVVSVSRSFYFESFSMTLRRGVSVGWYRCILQHWLAWSSLITISEFFADSSPSVSICISQRIVASSFSLIVSGLFIIIFYIFFFHFHCKKENLAKLHKRTIDCILKKVIAVGKD